MILPPDVKRIRVRHRVVTFFMKDGNNKRQDGEQRRTLKSVQRALHRQKLQIELEEGTDIYNSSSINPEEDCEIDINKIRSVLANSTWIAKPQKNIFSMSHFAKSGRELKHSASYRRLMISLDRCSGSSPHPHEVKEQNTNITVSCETPTYQRHPPKGPNGSKLAAAPAKKTVNVKVKANTELRSVRKSVAAKKLLYMGPPIKDRKNGSWPEGWTMEKYERQSGLFKGNVDTYFFSPKTKYRLRSMVEVERFLEEMTKHNENETNAIFEVEKWKKNRKENTI